MGIWADADGVCDDSVGVIMGSLGEDKGGSLSDRREVARMVGPAPQTVEDVATIGAGTHWRLPRPPPRPAALLLRFRPFEGEGITGATWGEE